MSEEASFDILLIEDSDDHAELVRRAFARSRDNFNLIRAASCKEASEVLKDILPIVIITDYLLPDGNGLNFYKHQLKSSYPNVPVLLLTSQGDETVAVDALKSGMTDYLVKSDQVLISLPDLCRAIIRETDQKLENRKHVEALRESEERYRDILHAALDGFWLVDRENRLIEVNESYCRMSGYSEQELLTMTIADLEASMTSNDIIRQAEQIIAQGYVRFTSSHRRKDGSIFDVEVSVKYQQIDDGKMVAFIRDITESKQAEEEKQLLEQQFQHSQKLESLGVLSGGIAHDFNNILAVIMGYCCLTRINYETAEKYIPEIEKAAERAAGLCRQMLAYAGKAPLTKTRVDMVTEVDDIVNMLKSTLPQNTAIKSYLAPKTPHVEGDASQLRQVVMNLIINASEAIGSEQGEVDVTLVMIKVMAGKAYEDYHGKAISPGDYVCLEVTDNGCGMDEATKWRIFEPFFSTKFTGRGLGMSAVLGIIKSHGGALQLFSQLGCGTTFKVYLPALTEEPLENGEQTVSAPVAPWQGSGTVLLAEDEESIREIAKTFLEMFGFNVLEAVNGKEALEIYQKRASEISIVLTDMGMPLMDGYELFSELKKLNPELPIIISSGYGDAEVTARIGSDNIAGLVSKPYNPNQLQEVLKLVQSPLQPAKTSQLDE